MYSLLIVEDEEIIRQGLQTTICWENYGFEVVAAACNGKEAWQLFGELRPDVVLTDIRMPFIDGIELLQRVKRELPRTQVVLLSSYEEFEYAQKGIEFDAYAYILKDRLHDEIDRCFSRLCKKLDQDARHMEAMPMKSHLLLTDERAQWLSDCNFFCCIICWIPVNTFADIIAMWKEEDTAFFRKGAYIVCVLGAQERNTLLQRKTLFISLLGSYQHIVRSLGEGSCVTARNHILNSYWDAMKALDVRRLQTGKANRVSGLTQLQANDLELAVLLCDSISLIRHLNALFFHAIHSKNVLMPELHTTCNKILHNFLSGLEAAGAGTEYISGQISLMFTIDSMIDLNNWMVEEVATLCKLLDNARGSSGRQGILYAVRLADERFADDLRLEDMAKYCYMTVSSFTNKFKDATGSTFSHYIRQKRMQHAKRLLRESDLKIFEIARECGYDDEKYFSRIFKATEHTTPAAWRQLHRQ